MFFACGNFCVRDVREANASERAETNILFRANIKINSSVAKIFFETTIGRISSYA
jgi:hypothetical protein